jgi:hypothetical protein
VEKCFHQTRSVITVQRDFQVRFDCREDPRRSTIERLVKKSEQIGSVIDNKKALLANKSL